METEEYRLDEPRQRTGCLRGFFIAIGVIIGLVVLVVVLILFLTSPSQAQNARLESSTGAAADIGPALSGGGTVIDIPQSVVTAMIEPLIEAALADVPELRFIGVDVRFEDEMVNVLAGVEGRITNTQIRRKAVLETRVLLELDPEGWIALTPVALKIGRLPLPVGRLARTIRWNQDWEQAGTSLEASGVRFDPAGVRLLVDPQPLLDQFIPGMEVRSIRAVRGSLRIALRVPDTLSRSLENLILAVAVEKRTLLAGLESVLPPDGKGLADGIRGLFDSVEGALPAGKRTYEGAMVSYAEGDVTAESPGSDARVPVDIGDRLAEGTRIVSGRNSWAELVLPPSHIVKVGAESEFAVDTAMGNGKSTALSLGAGRIRFLVSRLTDGDEFKISTPDAVMAVRGTDFVVDRSGSSTTQLSVLDGRVGIATPDGAGEVPVEADQTLTVKMGRMGNPVALDAGLRSEIAEKLGIRTRPADVADLMEQNIVDLALPHVMMAARAWAELDEDTQWAVQDVLKDHLESHPEIGRAVDEFFRANGLEDRRGEFEQMFE